MTKQTIFKHLRTALGVVFLAVLVFAYDRLMPTQHVPWQPLDPNAPIGWATGAKLDGLTGAPERCFAALDRGGVEYSRLEQSPPGEPCGMYDAINLERSATPYSAPVRMTCPLAVAVNIWERQVMQPAAERHFGGQIARIETYGTFSCRRVNGNNSGAWSQHAGANAIDISGFRLTDGRVVNIADEWRGDTPEGAFLEDVFAGACRVFRTGLGPDYNAAHADHFHFDMGGGFTCR